MCLAVPMRLERIDGLLGTAVIGGVKREVRLDLVEQPAVGDYVLVHAGFAIQLLDEEQARETLAIIEQALAADGVDPQLGGESR